MLLQERDKAQDQEHSCPNSLQTKIDLDQHRGHIRNLISSCDAFAARFMVKPIPKDGVIRNIEKRVRTLPGYEFTFFFPLCFLANVHHLRYTDTPGAKSFRIIWTDVKGREFDEALTVP
jgi:hypothetical protein